MKPFLLLSLVFLSQCLGLPAQELAPPAAPVAEVDKALERLMTLVPALQLSEKDLKELKAKLAKATTEEEKAEVSIEVDAQRVRVTQLRENFRTLATGVEESRYIGAEEESFSWEESLQDIIAPISREVREMTSEPREMDGMRNELVLWKSRQELSDAALARLKPLLDLEESKLIMAELESARKLWASRKAEADSQVQVLNQEIQEREASSLPPIERVSEVVADFWRSKGLNLLLALTAGVGGFFLTRWAYRLFRRISPIHRRSSHGLMARAADLCGAGMAVLCGVLAVVLVFYLVGDWLLLTLAVIAVFGVLWASKQALPPYLEQLRILLNIGPVRQGERLVYEGIPWRVDRLNFYCEFRNPELAGGVLRLPVRDVMPLHSRPAGAKEPWFPSHLDDWVVLADETYGKIIQQTPEQVVVLRLGGSLKTYATAGFLEQNPENLSRGFRIRSVFGIDYSHQTISTAEIPGVLQVALNARVLEMIGRGNLRSLKVELESAGASSLDYAILADFDGEVASRYNNLRRYIQEVCVDVCNERGWIIPFTQVTVHQAPCGEET